MAGTVILRSYLDLSNGPLENTVDYSNDNSPAAQEHSAMRKFTQTIGSYSSTIHEREGKGTVFVINIDSDDPESELELESAYAQRLADPENNPPSEANSLVYHKDYKIAKYCIDFGEDISVPKYLSFFNLDDKPVYLCKKARVSETGGQTTIQVLPYMKVLPKTSVGPVVFNPSYGNIFAVVDSDTAAEQNLYIVAYNG